MKKTLLFITTLFSLMLMCEVAFAVPANLTFTTIQQAQQYCPAPETGLLFTPYNSGPDSDGVVTGSQNAISFASVESPAMHPQTMNSENIIQGAQFRFVSGMYGFIANGVINCLYAYTGIYNGPTSIILRSKNSLPTN